MQAIERGIVVLAQWGTIATGFLLVLAAVGFWRLGRGGRLPGTWPRRAASVLLFLAIPVLGFVLFLLAGPMRSMLAEVTRVHSMVGQPAADLAFQQVSDGAPRHLRDFRGQVVVLNLWATWCPPCRDEMPDLNRLQQEYGDRGVTVVTLSDEPREVIEGFAKEQPFATMNVFTTALGWLNMPGRPFSVVIDREGTVRELFVGARGYEAFEAAIQPYLLAED